MENFNLKEDFGHLMNRFPDAKVLLENLSEEGDLLLFGGVAREYIDSRFQTLPRDIDIVVHTTHEIESSFHGFRYKKNRFGGYKVYSTSMEFDIWTLPNTWAFKENKLPMSEENLPKTVFLNVDAITFNLSKNKWNDSLFQEAMTTRVLDVVLMDNPFPELNLFRALVIKRKYHMSLSPLLTKCFLPYLKQKEGFIELFHQIQFPHYQQAILTKKVLEEEYCYLINLM